MSDRPLSVAFWNYDRTLPLTDGRVTVAGATLACSFLRPEVAFTRAFSATEFDISELSLSNTITAVSQGYFAYRLIPVFLSRAFRHSAIFVRTDRGIRAPSDLVGRTIGLQEYDMTAALVARGLLRDQYGINANDMRWCVGNTERLKPLEFPVGAPPTGVEIEILPPGGSVDQLLETGKIDAVITLRPPPAWQRGDLNIAPLFADPAAEEQAYYSASGVFPIMHAVGVRTELLQAQPNLGRRLYDAFCSAKTLAIEELEVVQASKVTLPWAGDALRRARAVLGHDVWPYGIEANRHTLETELRWSREDGLQARPIQLEELFDPGCLDT